MSIDKVISALENGIYAGHLSSFNDPYEYEGILYPDNYRVCCLTKSSRKMLMWAHYGNHRGCCVGFQVDDNDLREVIYSTDFYRRSEMDKNEVLENLYVKSSEWSYENEYRIICKVSEFDSKKWSLRKVNEVTSYFFKAKVVEVVFGIRTNFKDQNCQELLKTLQKINYNQEKLKVKACTISDTKYEIIFNNQFEYEMQILHE